MLQLKWIHRILEFKQELFLKPYIERNVELWREAEKENNKIKKQYVKLRNCVIFGKQIENATKRLILHKLENNT